MKSNDTFVGRTGRDDGETGATIVEFAMSIGLLLCMIFAIIQLAIALYAFTFTAEAAREATRYASVRGSQCAGFTYNCPLPGGSGSAASSAINTWVQGLGYPFARTMTATATWSCSPTASPCNSPGNTVSVTVKTSFPLVIPLPLNNASESLTYSLKSTSQMVISQ